MVTFMLKKSWKEAIKLTDYIWIIPILFGLAIQELYSYIKFSKSIKKGIDILRDGSALHINYLIISKHPTNNNQIIVKNDALWIELGFTKTYDSELLLEMLIADFEVIAKYRSMKNYLYNKTVIFNVYKYGVNAEELLKTAQKIYGN
jgi:hypothetical protein